jgi:ABC-type sugar transport system permease subunit
MNFKKIFHQKYLPYWFILPTIIALIVFTVYPLVSGIYYSFTDIEYVGGSGAWLD